jgi:hypothetical protein
MGPVCGSLAPPLTSPSDARWPRSAIQWRRVPRLRVRVRQRLVLLWFAPKNAESSASSGICVTGLERGQKSAKWNI